jgi:N-methylhydantoinase A
MDDLLLRSWSARHRERITGELLELLRIPSISADPAHAGDVRRSAEHVAGLLGAAGLEHVQLLETGGGAGLPAVYADWLRAGGDKPTVTDANVIAGRINPAYFLGGELQLNPERAVQAMEPVAAHFGLSPAEAALGVIRLVNANMINALKLISVRRGYDPRDFTLLACGGGGSMHAAALARELKIGKVVVPPGPGHFSAFGMLLTDLRHDFIQTGIVRTDQAGEGHLNSVWEAMEREAAAIFAREKIAPENMVFARAADMRYFGQEHTVKVPVPGGMLTPKTIKAVEEKFHELHEMYYTFRLPDSLLEFVNYHLTAFGTVRKPQLKELPAGGADPARAWKGEREVDYDEQGKRLSRIYERDLLAPGMRVAGPAVVEEQAASTVIHPGQEMVVDQFANLVIHTGV